MMIENYAKMIEWSLKTYPECKIFESLSPNQIASKMWLIEELKHISLPQNNKIEIVGSWYGYPLIDFLNKAISIEKIECWDIDKEARMVAKQYLKIFQDTKTSIFSKNYWLHERTASEATLLINTSSEHMMESFYQMKGKWDIFYHKKPVIVIQSNNMRYIKDHINCVDNEEELIEKHKIKHVFYADSADIVQWNGTKIEPSGYKRFMVIGKL